MTSLLLVGLEPPWMIEPWHFVLQFSFEESSDQLDATRAAAVGATIAVPAPPGGTREIHT